MITELVHVTAYRFISFADEELLELKSKLLDAAIENNIKGTILLGHEGINISLTGEADALYRYQNYLTEWPKLHDLHFKKTDVKTSAFRRMKVLIKKEIVTMGRADINPAETPGAYVTPEQLRSWYREGRDVILLDTRNDYEVRLGKFSNAIDLNIKSFRDFPQAIEQLPETTKQKTIVTYCTGGIRCEKVTALMNKMGYEQVYQLQGGIIHYFEQCGGDFFEGKCFVFDDRITIDHSRHESRTPLCVTCQVPLTSENSSDFKCLSCQTVSGHVGS